jgi:hypothetical protein
MATWKKVLIQDANITVGSITATLANNATDITSANSGTTFNMVTSANAGGASGALEIRTMNLGTAAFAATGDFLASGAAARDLTTSGGLTGGQNNVLVGSDADVDISLADIADLRVLGNVTGSSGSPSNLVEIKDEDDMTSDSATALATQQSIKAYVDSQTSTPGNGTITVTAGAGIASGTATSFTVNQGGNTTVAIAVDGVLEDLDSLGAASNDGEFIVATGAGTFAYESGATVRTSLGLGTANSPSFTNLTLSGNLTVNGTTTTLDTANLLVEDKIIMVANTTTPTPDTGTASGLEVETSTTAANRPRFEWTKDLGASNDGTYDGSGTAVGLTGWGLKNHQESNQALFPIAIMQMEGADATAPSGNSAGIGSFYFASSNIGTAAGELYLRVL